MSEDALYSGREQTQIKHFILRKYLERFAHIVGHFADAITYVDCFSGPWNVKSPELKDASFSIALEELRKARDTLSRQGKVLRIRCLFLEKDPQAYRQLAAFADSVKDAHVETRHCELREGVPAIRDFIVKGGKNAFPFIFIDPTGWTGFEMDLIGPLLRINPVEILINFMTDYIRRFIDHPQKQTRDQFEGLFGSAGVKARIQALTDPQDREDELFRNYATNVRRIGHFPFTCAAIVQYPDVDRRYFHLIYATRSRKGVEVFKQVEKQAMELMQETRADAKKRKRERKTSQLEMFSGTDLPDVETTRRLRDRYLSLAKEYLVTDFNRQRRIPYETAWDIVLALPLVWESDLKEWIAEWKAEKQLTVEGLQPAQRVPHLNKGHFLCWNGPAVE